MSPLRRHGRSDRGRRSRTLSPPRRRGVREERMPPPRRERRAAHSVDSPRDLGMSGGPRAAAPSVQGVRRATKVQLGRPSAARDGDALAERMQIPGVAAALKGLEERRWRGNEMRRSGRTREEEERARRPAWDAMELDERESARNWDDRDAVCGPARTGGGHTATFFGGHAPPFHSWRDEKLLWSSHSPSSPLLKAHNVSLAPRVRRPLPAAPSHPAAPVQRMPDSDASSRSTRVRSLEGAFQSGLTGPSTMSFSPSPIPDSPRAAPTVAKHGTREFSLLAHPVPPPLPPARAAACGQRIVWLGPLPADLAPAELAAILDGYDVAQYAMHPVNQATHAGAVALEVEAKSAEGAEELQADVRGGMIPLRGAAVDVYACNPRQELIGEVGRARPEQEKRATGAFADKRLVTNATVAPDSTWTASEADGNSGFSPMEGVAAEEEQCEPGVIAATLTSTHVASNLAWHMPLSLRGGSSLADPSCSLSPSVSLPTRLAETHLPSTAQPSALLQTGSTPPSPTLPPSRRSFSPSHAPTPPGRAHYTIHPTRARSPYPRSPSPGADDLYATREAEIEDEMRCEVVDALEERKVRDEWETRERWYARWERVEVIDLTSDEGDEEAMAVDA